MPPRSVRFPAARSTSLPPVLRHPRHLVTAVLVAHDGAAWLPTALGAVTGQHRPVQRIVAVDTGSEDATASLLTAAFDVSGLVTAPRDTPFGAAVALGLAASSMPAGAVTGAGQAGEPVEWVWLLHDDCAPDPGCLEALLDLADHAPSAGVIGPKVRDWDDPRQLVEVGLTTDTAGRLVTGLEWRELDQGQHDAVRDVLAVGTAGALVRREVWDRLGGLDPELPVFRDDIDLGWRVNLAGYRVVVAPQATIRHARAAVTGRRTLSAATGRPSGIDRRHALYTLLVNISTPALLSVVPRILLGAVLRAVVFLLTRRPGAALEEIRALVFTLGHPGRLAKARRRRAATRTEPSAAARHLLAGRVARLRHYLEALVALGDDNRAVASSPGARQGETGPSEADDELAAGPPTGLARRLLRRPSVALVLGLLLVALIAEHVLFGSGRLVGGQALPAPSGASELWSTYLSGWHRVSAGSGVPAPPYLAVLAGLATVLFGKAWLAVDVLLLGSVPLAGLSAYVAAARVVRSPVLRCWGAAAYALLPVLTGAVAGGRLGVAVGTAALPMLLHGGWRVLHDDPRDEGWRRAWATGFGLALGAAFAPLLYPVAGLLLSAGIATVLLESTPASRAAALRRASGGVIVAAVPLLVLFPWTAYVPSHPGVLLLGIGRVYGGADVSGWQLLLLHPGGPGLAPVWLGGPVVVAALAGLLRGPRRTVALAGWGLALLGVVAGLLVTRLPATPGPGEPEVTGWPGIGVAVTAAGLLLAALVAAEQGPSWLTRRSFGWRQPIGAALVLSTALVPVVAAGAWLVRGAADPVQRRSTAVLPAFAASLVTDTQRVLYLRVDATGTVRYDLAGPGGARLGDAEFPVSARQRRVLDGLVGRLTSTQGAGAATALATYDVRFVVLASDDPTAAVANRLDGQAGLSRASYDAAVALWALTPAFGRLVTLPPSVAALARTGHLPDEKALPAPTSPPATGAGVPPVPARGTGDLVARPYSASGAVPAGPVGRLLVLSEARDDGWRASVDGARLVPQTAWGWAQAFTLPPTGGALRLRYHNPTRNAELLVQAVLLGLVLILAGPTPRRDLFAVSDDPPAEQAPTPVRTVR